MRFPEKPTCHVVNPVFKLGDDIHWREPRKDDQYGRHEPFRTCSYCGSIHPEDLIRHLQNGAELHGSDWKYGWPHKFYVEGIPNEFPGDECQNGSRFFTENGEQREEPIMGKPPATSFTKWYNEHILDEGFDEEARAALLEALKSSGIEFSLEGEKLKYRAPRYGYQKA